MKKRLLSTFIVIVLLFSFCSVSFASTDDGNAGIVPYSTHSVLFTIDRASSTVANAAIVVEFSQTVDTFSVVVYLQKYSGGEWVTDYTNDDYVIYNNGIKKDQFIFTHKYTGLTRGTTYRLKCVSRDYIGDNVHIATSYSHSF